LTIPEVVTPVSIFSPPPPPPPAVDFPLEWLLDNGSPAIQYRAINEVAQLTGELTPAVNDLPYSYAPALELAVQASVDGIWNNSMLALPPQRAMHFEGIGTIPAFRRLIEYGWSKDAPTLFHSRRNLFRLLAEDSDRELLYELNPARGKNCVVARRA
jgi:hypothetical protein